MESTRQNKVARQIQKDISEILQRLSSGWFPGKLITVTVVRITPDLGIAKIYVSIFPSANNKEAIKTLNTNRNIIRNELAKKIRHQLKKIPELLFYLDDSLDYIENIDNILNTR